MQLRDKGIIVKALADVALHMACGALRHAPQALQQRRCAGGHEAWSDHGMHQRSVEAPAPGEALMALELALCWHRSTWLLGLHSPRLLQ